jgi:hypothetical protein
MHASASLVVDVRRDTGFADADALLADTFHFSPDDVNSGE